MIETKEQLDKELFEPRILFGHKVIATDERIDPSILPKGIYKYELQESECYPFDTTMIGKRIHVNFESTVLSTDPIRLDMNGYRDIEPEDISIPTAFGLSLKDYLKHQRNKEMER